MKTTLTSLFLTLLLLLGTGCDTQKVDDFPPYDNSAEVEAHYKAKPDFFKFASLGDLPAGLIWENGADLPEIGSPQAKKGGDFRYFIDQYPPTYREVGPEANNSFRSEHWDNIYITPAMPHPNVEGRYMPGLAKEWAISEDKRTVFYRLDPDAAFTRQNHRTLAWTQEPCRVDDFFFLFYIQTHDYLQDPWSKNYYTTKFSSITKYDDLTFSMTLPEPKADPIYWTSLVPYCRKAFADFGPDYVDRYNWRTTPTVGAYAIDLETTIKNRKVVMKRIPNWWAKDKKNYRYRFNADRILYTTVNSMDKAFEVFRKGEIDYFPLNSPRYWYEKMDIPPFNDGYITKTKFYNRWPRPPYGFYINCGKPLLSQREVRLGLQHAMNVQKIIDVDMRGDYPRLNSTSEGYGSFTEPTQRARAYDPEQARKHFANAGFTQSGNDGILRNAKGERLSVELLVRAAPPTHKQYALRLKEEAKRAGLELTIEVLDNQSAFKKTRDKKHDMTLMAWNSTPPFPRYWEGYHSVNAYETNENKEFKKNPDGTRIIKPDTNNISSTSDPELDKVIDAYEKAATVEELRTLSHQASRMIHEEASFIPGWNMNFLRCGYWQWVKWPEDFNVAAADLPESTFVYWIDEEDKRQATADMKAGKRGEPKELIFDKYRDQ